MILCDCLPEVAPNQASFDYFPVEISLAAHGIVWGPYQEPETALQMLSVMVWLLSSQSGCHNCRNLHFSRPILHIALTELVDYVPPSRLCQIVKPHLLLPKALHAVLYVLEIVPITQPGSSSSLSLPSSVTSSSSSSSSPSSSSSELARSLKLPPITFSFSSNVVSGCVVVDRAFSNLPQMFLLLHNRCLGVLN